MILAVMKKITEARKRAMMRGGTTKSLEEKGIETILVIMTRNEGENVTEVDLVRRMSLAEPANENGMKTETTTGGQVRTKVVKTAAEIEMRIDVGMRVAVEIVTEVRNDAEIATMVRIDAETEMRIVDESVGLTRSVAEIARKKIELATLLKTEMRTGAEAGRLPAIHNAGDGRSFDR